MLLRLPKGNSFSTDSFLSETSIKLVVTRSVERDINLVSDIPSITYVSVLPAYFTLTYFLILPRST